MRGVLEKCVYTVDCGIGRFTGDGEVSKGVSTGASFGIGDEIAVIELFYAARGSG